MIIERITIDTGGGVIEIERVYEFDEERVDYLPLPLREFIRPVSVWEDLGWMTYTDFEEMEDE